MSGKKKLPSPEKLQALGEELVASPKQKANNLPLLIASLASNEHQLAPVIHSLKLFFMDAFARGDLSAKPPEQQEQADPAAVYAAWLHRQYGVFLSALFALLRSASEPRVQVAALQAGMECVRGEEAGAFNNQLYGRLLEVVVSARGVIPEVVGALLSRFLPLADVRYFTLRTLTRLAERRAVRAAGGAAGAGAGAQQGGAESDQEDAEDEEEEVGKKSSGSVSAHDLARNMFDVLVAVLPLDPEAAAAGQLSSWCCAAEAGLVAPANEAEGVRQRKKRRLAQAAAAAAEGPEPAGQAQQQQQQQQQRAKWASGRHQARAYSEAWLAFLRCDLPDDIYRKVLVKLPDTILPGLANPLLLSDFLTHSLDKGGLIGMLALNGIFLLVTRHGLEYPHFYARLYGLLTPQAFMAKHRLRFFQLADVFLASGMVPAYTAAAFAKRFARLGLQGSPAAALIALGFIHNIIRRHAACMQLLHRPRAAAAAPAAPAPAPALVEAAGANGAAARGAAGKAENEQGGQQQQQPGTEELSAVYRGLDVYDPQEPDPAKSRAIESSLWELEALRRHAFPGVASFTSILDKDLGNRKKTAEVDISELLEASYAGLFAKEAGRRLKMVPTAFYAQPPTHVMDANCAADFGGWALSGAGAGTAAAEPKE